MALSQAEKIRKKKLLATGGRQPISNELTAQQEAELEATGSITAVPKLDNVKFPDKRKRLEYPNIILKRRDIYSIEKEEREREQMRKDNMRTRKILDDLKKKREAKRKRRELRKNVKGFNRRKDNYCGFKWGFLL